MSTLKAKKPAEAKPRKPKIVVYGAAGVGKTWTVLDFPRVYYIDAEGGACLSHYTQKLAASGGVYLGPDDGANDPKTICEQVVALATTKHEFRTLAIGSFSKAFGTAIQVEYDRLSEQRYTDMTKTFGAEKKPAIAFARRLITWFDRLDMNVILECHEKEEWKDGKVVRTIFDGWEKLEYELDLILRVVKQGPERKALVGKSRLLQFKDGDSFPWSYEAFASLYGRQIMEAEATTTKLASTEQIVRISELLEVVKLDDEQRVKWFDKAGVDNWAQMDDKTIQACVDYLTKKIQAPHAIST